MTSPVRLKWLGWIPEVYGSGVAVKTTKRCLRDLHKRGTGSRGLRWKEKLRTKVGRFRVRKEDRRKPVWCLQWSLSCTDLFFNSSRRDYLIRVGRGEEVRVVTLARGVDRQGVCTFSDGRPSRRHLSMDTPN